jgi:hypothetical protein
MEEQQLNGVADVIVSKVPIREDNYRGFPALNNSKLSRLASSPASVNIDTPPTDSMILGSIVDNMLTKGVYGDEFVVATVDKPAGQMGDFCDYYLEEMLADNPDAAVVAYTRVGFKRDSLEKVMQKFEEGIAKEYYRQLLKAQGKTLVSMDMIAKATKVSNRVLTTPEICDLFVNGKKREGIEIVHQLPITFELPEAIGLGKALLDVVVIDHNKETVEIYDLKTTSDSSSRFRSSYMKWKYYLQASYYYYGMKSISKYTVKGFKFITVSTIFNEPAVMWECSNEDLMIGANGIERPYSNERVKGWRELVNEYFWHENNNRWDLPMELCNDEPNMLNVFSKWS